MSATNPITARHHRALIRALELGIELLKNEGAEALAFNLDQARCNRKFAAAEVVNRFRKNVKPLIGTPFFPVAEAEFMGRLTQLSGVAMDTEWLYSAAERETIARLIAGGYVKHVTEVFSATRAVSFWTLDFSYENLDRTNG